MYVLQTNRRISRRWTAGEPRAWRARWVVLGLGATALLGLGGARLAADALTAGHRPVSYQTVTVARGDTLWAIAARRYPDADVRQKVFEIEKLNGMAGPVIEAGQQLKVPSS
jgi:nucleoid-associated protein YgaU